MTEEYIVERLALFCNSSLMLSIDGSQKPPDFSWDLVILKTLVCQQPPLPGALSLRLLWSKPTSCIPPGRLPQHTRWRVSNHHHQPSLFQKALHEYCALSFLYALKFRFSVEFLTWEMFMWMFLKPSACVEISGTPVITASLGWESTEQRCSWPKCYMWKPIPSLIFAVLVSCLLLVLMKSHCFQKSLLSIFEEKKIFIDEYSAYPSSYNLGTSMITPLKKYYVLCAF